MDRQFDCRVLLANIPNTLSDDERKLFNFVIGNNVSRVDRENTTLGGILNNIETLFQQEKITEDNLGFLIEVFDAINVKTAVSRLKAFQSSRRPYKEHQPLVARVFGDNGEDEEFDKQATHVLSPFLPLDRNSCALPGIEEVKSIKTVSSLPSPETKNITNKAVVSIQSKFFQKISKSPLSLFLSVLFLLNIITLVIYVSIVFPKLRIAISTQKKIHRDVYQIKKATFCTNITDAKWIDHARNLSLTFNNQLQSIKLYSIKETLCSVEFIYSETQFIKHNLTTTCGLSRQTNSSLNLIQNITEIVQYYNNKKNKPAYIEGLAFLMNQHPLVTYGSSTNHSCGYRFEDYRFGYALGIETDHYLNGFEFLLYKTCSSDTKVEICMPYLDVRYLK